jgi:hypothetical protein
MIHKAMEEFYVFVRRRRRRVCRRWRRNMNTRIS